jgi:putative ABC transport system substrate-binding protein
MMHGSEKSDPVIVAGKPTNKAERSAAELVEPRAGTKGNADRQSTHWTQSQARVSHAFERIRQAVAVTHPRWEPHAGKPHVRICAGGARQLASLPLKRRTFIAALGGAAAWPLVARGQQVRKLYQIGVLLPGTPATFARRTNAFLEGMRTLGYVEGQTINIEWRWGQDKVEGLPEFAADLVGRKPDVLVTAGTSAAKALKNATGTIPIVMAIIGDPVAVGLADSLAVPGGNATGLSVIAPELSGKRLELLKEIAPYVSSVGVLLNTTNPQSHLELKETETAAYALGLKVQPIEFSPERTLEQSFATTSNISPQSLIVLTDPILFSQRKKIVELATSSRLPGMYNFREFVAVGGLMSYGPNDTDLYSRAASYVDKILKGAKPTELPIEQPTKFDLVINLKTAKAIGLEVPPSLLARADEVIE